MQKILATINYKCDFYKKAIETGKVDICESERQLLSAENFRRNALSVLLPAARSRSVS